MYIYIYVCVYLFRGTFVNVVSVSGITCSYKFGPRYTNASS